MSLAIDRALRDFERYSGDGLLNAPVNRPLPVGDPASGVHAIRKAELRAALNEIAVVGDGRWLNRVSDFATDAILTYSAGAGQVPVGSFIMTRQDGLSLQVMPSAAVDYDFVNANGVKVLLTSVAEVIPGSVSDAHSTAKYDLVAGALRQNPTDRTRWQWLSGDGAHEPVGVDPDPNLLGSDGVTPLYPRAAGDTLLFFYKQNTDARKINVLDANFYDRIGAVPVHADEVLSRDWGITVGSRVTRSGVQVKGSMHKERVGRLHWNGTEMEAADDAAHPAGAVTTSWNSTTGVLTVNHDWLPGYNLFVEPDLRDSAGTISSIWIPVFDRVVSNTQFQIKFLVPSGSNAGFDWRTGALGFGASFRWKKSYHGPVIFDGSDGWDAIPWHIGGTANLWVGGCMRREAPL